MACRKSEQDCTESETLLARLLYKTAVTSAKYLFYILGIVAIFRKLSRMVRT